MVCLPVHLYRVLLQSSTVMIDGRAYHLVDYISLYIITVCQFECHLLVGAALGGARSETTAKPIYERRTSALERAD